jgi:hypothetical protein
MAKSPVLTKQDMYRRLANGEFGNTIAQFFSLESWQNRGYVRNYGLWGVRSASIAGDKRCRLNVPEAEVEGLWKEWFPCGGGNISPMLDKWAVLRCEVFINEHDPRSGLTAFYVPAGFYIDESDPWRGSFRNYGKQVSGLQASMLLKAYCWPSDLENLMMLVEEYPGHVVEFSACDRAVGVIPNRNTVIWECRRY